MTKFKRKWLLLCAAGLLLVAVIFGFRISTTTAYAATTPKYTMTFSGTYYQYTWGGGATVTITDQTSATVNYSGGKTETVYLYLTNQSGSSGPATLADNSTINFGDITISCSNSGATLTVSTLTGTSKGSGTGSTSLSLSDGGYKVMAKLKSDTGAGYTKFGFELNLTAYINIDTAKPTIIGAATTTTGKYTNEAFTVTATDSGSGIDKLYYKSPSASRYSSTSNSSYTVSSSATSGIYRFYATDNAGNTGSTYYVYLDTVKPTGTLYAGTNTISSGSTTTEEYIKFVASDTLSGIKTVYVKTPNSSSYITCASGSQYTAKGSYSFYCMDNAGNTSTTYTISLNEKHVHSYVPSVTSPTCTSGGYTVYTCSCGNSYTGDRTEALGHKYVVSEGKDATCGDGGYTVYTCSRCGDEYKEYGGTGEGHTYYDSTVEPTCTEKGYILHKCTKCDYEYKSDETEALGHNYDTKVVTAATCTTSGERVHKCSRCGDEYTTVIPATGHNYSITNENNNGGNVERTYTCSDCSESHTEELGEQYAKVSNYVEYLFEQYSPYMWWVLLATASIWSIVMGVMIIIAQRNEEKAKAKRMLVNYFIGLVAIAVIVVACPYLVRGIAGLIS